MSEESTTPDREELAAPFRTTFPDGTDWAQLARDAAWAKARHSGIVQDFRVAYIWTYRGGRLVHCRGLAGVDEALKVVGLEG